MKKELKLIEANNIKKHKLDFQKDIKDLYYIISHNNVWGIIKAENADKEILEYEGIHLTLCFDAESQKVKNENLDAEEIIEIIVDNDISIPTYYAGVNFQIKANGIYPKQGTKTTEKPGVSFEENSKKAQEKELKVVLLDDIRRFDDLEKFNLSNKLKDSLSRIREIVATEKKDTYELKKVHDELDNEKTYCYLLPSVNVIGRENLVPIYVLKTNESKEVKLDHAEITVRGEPTGKIHIHNFHNCREFVNSIMEKANKKETEEMKDTNSGQTR